ncbi:MAG: peptidase M23 [Pseudonocardiales bacterium]|nr:MAG: peptidase M23 [Pseudonocardiales bacterium]
MPTIEPAYLKFLQSSKDGPGGPTSVNGKGHLDFGFNPKEYTVAKTAEWKRNASKGAKQSSMPEFVGPQARTITLEMFLDAAEKAGKDVVADIETLMACLVPLPASGPKALPPFVQFGWGKLVILTAYVKSVSVKITMFRADGSPVRATCSLTLEEVPNKKVKPQNPTSGALHASSSHVIVAGDSLASLAYSEYGDPTLWRAIADANRIDDPLRLQPGRRLVLPAIEEVSAAISAAVPVGTAVRV